METSLHRHFKWIPDPRTGNNKKHNLTEIIILSVLSVLCGADSWYEMEEFCQEKEEFLKKLLPLCGGIPSHDTFNRVFMMIDAGLFERCFRAWTAELSESLKTISPITERELIAIDGKTICNSVHKRDGLGALHMVSAWSGRNQLVLGQQKVADKSNEITAIPELLSLLNIKGAVVTIDAMGTQKEIAAKIVEHKGDYILALKQNQRELYDQVLNQFNFKEDSYSQHLDKGHGRSEIRTCRVISNLNYVDEKENWQNLKSIVKITSERIIGDSHTTQDRYYISSLEDDAAYFNQAVRAHWGIENQLHWQLDVGFGEDYNTTRDRRAAQNFSVVRKLALNILKADTSNKSSLKAKRKKAGWNNEYLLKLIINVDF
jgi:predicted transposase YbfD/YdcC